MSEILFAALAAFVVEAARSSGRETGVKIVAALGPYLTAEQAGHAWEALVKACREASKEMEQHGVGVMPEEWVATWAVPTANPVTPPDPGPM
jgi:hypothetical protein